MRLTEEIKQEIRACESSRFELCASLHDEDIPELVEILQTKPSIQYLDLSSNKIEQTGAINLSQLKHLIHLNLSNNNITNEAVRVLLLNKNLLSLNCSKNPLLDNKLGEAIINKPTHHTSLKFNRTQISGDILHKIEMICIKNREIQSSTVLKAQEERKEIDAASESIDPKANEPHIKKYKLTNTDKFFAFFKCLSSSNVESIEVKKHKVRI